MTYSPLVAITMGDAAGIGAEIIMKSLWPRRNLPRAAALW